MDNTDETLNNANVLIGALARSSSSSPPTLESHLQRQDMDPEYDVIVIGAGLGGLVAAKTFLQIEPNLSIVLLDANESIGGTWSKERIYPGLLSNNLRGTFEFSDFPMDDTFGAKDGEHIPGEALHEYFCAYADKFDIARRIWFRTKVLLAQKLAVGWSLDLESHWATNREEDKILRTLYCKKLIVATGLTSSPNPINIKGSAEFTPPIVNFADYARAASAIYKDKAIKHVTVYGGSKSAYDMVYLMASHGKEVTWIIRASGHGPAFIAPSHITIGPFKHWIETLASTRPLTWFSPCVWGHADGFGYIREKLHGTRVGRWMVQKLWDKMETAIRKQTGMTSHPSTHALIPKSSMLWYGGNIPILNYPNDIYSFIRKNQVRVIREDMSHLSCPNVVNLASGTQFSTGALLCTPGWKYTPSFTILPTTLHADLGIPSTQYTAAQTATWATLDARADRKILTRFPMLRTGPKPPNNHLLALNENPGSPDSPTTKGPIITETETTPWRLWRGVAPPSLPSRDVIFIGMQFDVHSTLRSEISSLWGYAYMKDQLPGPLTPLHRRRRPKNGPRHKARSTFLADFGAEQLRINNPFPFKQNEDATTKTSSDRTNCTHHTRDHSFPASPPQLDILYDTALSSRFGKHRTPYGFGARHPDSLFEGLPYFDLLLRDLGVRCWRKGWGFVGEVFGGGYLPGDYRGIVGEWMRRVG